MNQINGYHAYQSTFNTLASAPQSTTKATAENTATKKECASRLSAAKKTSEKNSSPVLSDQAKALLQELKKTYGNMDFIVSDCDSEEETQSSLAKGTKEYTVLIDSEELERMAADEEVKAQNLALLDDAVSNLDALKEELKNTENGDSVIHLGVTIGKDGNVSYFAELERIGERQKEFTDALREKTQTEREEAQQKTSKADTDSATSSAKSTGQGSGKVRKTTVYASSVQELLENISGVDWDSIPEEALLVQATGSRFDLSI